MYIMSAIIDKEIIQDGDVSKEEEDYIFNPYNENNIEITEAEVSVILKKYGCEEDLDWWHCPIVATRIRC